MTLAAFEPVTPGIEQLQTHVLDRAATTVCVLGGNSNVLAKLEKLRASRNTIGL
jgi:hypothetical protein